MTIPARVPPRNNAMQAGRANPGGRILNGLAEANPIFAQLFNPVINRIGQVMTKFNSSALMNKVGLGGKFKY